MRARLTPVLASTALLGIAVASFSQAAPPEPREIEVKNYVFGPAPEGLHVGDVVKWVNKDNVEHTATANDGSFNVILPPGGSGETQLKQAGVIDYFCRVHPYMKGKLTVAAK